MSYTFTWMDYAVMIFMLTVTIFIGIYYSFFKKHTSQEDYLLGGKQMNVWAISFSIISSTVSGIPLLTFPTEVYRYGIHFTFALPTIVLVSFVTYYVYLPVFYKLQITSTYEYLKLRFSNKVRIFASLLYTIFMIIYLPIVIYVPGLAISQVTGINLYYITPLLCGICIFYTTLGGLKAVVWTDAIQYVGMTISMVIVLGLGIFTLGGFQNIWRRNSVGGRFNLDFDVDITKRDTVWTGTISTLFTWISLISVNQGVVQKCLALSSFKKIKFALIIFTLGFIILILCCFLLGLVIYAKYYDCDPFLSGQIRSKDQLVPNFVLDIGEIIPGLPGVFISGILSAGLSTLSASLNCLAATIYQDFISPFIPRNTKERSVGFILRSIVGVVGIICTLLVYAVEHMGSVLPVAYSFISVTGGPLLGIFTAGMLLPIINTKGILTGGISALLIMGWITFKSQWYQLNNILIIPELPVDASNCNRTRNIWSKNHTGFLSNVSNVPLEENIFVLYKMSHFHYTLISVVIVITVSLIVSYMTKNKRDIVNEDCISPLVYFLLFNKTERTHNKQNTLLLKKEKVLSN